MLPFLTSDSQGPKSSDDEFVDDAGKKNDAQYPAKDGDKNGHEKDDSTCIFRGAHDNEDVGAKADLNNLETTMNVCHIPTTRIHKDHPEDQIIRDINSAIQTRRMINFSKENAMMSYVWELAFFLRLKVQQKEDEIFISQDKYVADILKKSMIGSLMYLTASRPDIMFVVCAYARDSLFDLEAFSDSDYAGASLDRKSTIGCCQFLGKRCYGSKIKCLIMGSIS
ncbi:hypothetical protein Tco_1537870 [Tanacetum coccineum]